jgi:hypothetical protein
MLVLYGHGADMNKEMGLLDDGGLSPNMAINKANKGGERGRNRTYNLLIKSRSNSERYFPAFAYTNQ